MYRYWADRCISELSVEQVRFPTELAERSEFVRSALTRFDEQSGYSKDLKLEQEFYSKKLIFAEGGLESGKPQTVLSFLDAAKNGGKFDLGKIPDPDVKEYNQFVLSPKAFFESKFQRNIVLITTVGAIKAENARIKNTENAQIYQLDKLLEGWEEKWKDEAQQLKYDDSDMVVFARWGADSLKEYKYLAGMFPKQDFLKLESSKRSLYELLWNKDFSRQNGGGVRRSWCVWGVPSGLYIF